MSTDDLTIIIYEKNRKQETRNYKTAAYHLWCAAVFSFFSLSHSPVSGVNSQSGVWHGLIHQEKESLKMLLFL